MTETYDNRQPGQERFGNWMLNDLGLAVRARLIGEE